MKDIGRSLLGLGQALCELNPGTLFDLFREADDDLAEDPNLFLVVLPGNQEIRRMPQSLQPRGLGASGNCLVQFLEVGTIFSHMRKTGEY